MLKRASIVAIVTVASTACATQRATINAYVDPTYQPGGIQHVAVFPIRNARLAPSEAQQINRKISTALHSRNPDIVIMSSPDAVRLLNQNDLADDWAKFLEDYVMSGVPDAKTLREIGSALGVDAIIQGEIVNIFQQDGAYGRNAGTTRVTVRYSMLDAKDGKRLWEASSDGIATTATTVEAAPPILKAVDLAVDKIVENLPQM